MEAATCRHNKEFMFFIKTIQKSSSIQEASNLFHISSWAYSMNIWAWFGVVRWEWDREKTSSTRSRSGKKKFFRYVTRFHMWTNLIFIRIFNFTLSEVSAKWLLVDDLKCVWDLSLMCRSNNMLTFVDSLQKLQAHEQYNISRLISIQENILLLFITSSSMIKFQMGEVSIWNRHFSNFMVFCGRELSTWMRSDHHRWVGIALIKIEFLFIATYQKLIWQSAYLS